MKKEKALFILHYSPPIHGASKVGDTIINSKIINQNLNSKFIKIKSSQNLDQIGQFNFLKILHFIELFFKVIYSLLIFRPKIIYFTTSSFGFAFYRDLVLSVPIKCYCFFKSCQVFYHYHAKGIYTFTSSSKKALTLTNFFVKGVNLIFISELMKSETELLKSYKNVFYLKNGVDDTLTSKEFNSILESRDNSKTINVLYLSNMMLDKGYDTALELAQKVKSSNKQNKIKFHFAGGWSSKEDEIFFNNYIDEHNLKDVVTYYGLVQGGTKKELFKLANLFVFPSRYKKEVFPLSILEALSYGLPVLAFKAGAVSEIINKNNGLITNKERIFEAFNFLTDNYLNRDTYQKCRDSFIENYTVNIFEENLLSILKTEIF